MSQQTHLLIDEFRRQLGQGRCLDVEQFVADFGPIAPTQLAELLMADQSYRWKQGDRKTTEQYLANFPELMEHRESAIDLLFAEFLLRERFNLPCSVDEMVRPFPQFRDELRLQVEFNQAIDGRVSNSRADNDALPLSRDKKPTPSAQPPDIPGYTILGELGRGGIGVVYKARHVQLNRPVALKMLLAGRFASASLLRRFLVEAEATARLQHPNIVQIYEVGQCDGRPFLALEFVNGGTLSQWTGGRPQPPNDAAELVLVLARAVQFAHDQGVLHRDLKPGNVLIQQLDKRRDWGDVTLEESAPAEPNESFHADREVVPASFSNVSGFLAKSTSTRIFHQKFQVKIADFGLAKLLASGSNPDYFAATMSGDVLGTAAYMSPEQARGDSANLSGLTDVYSLGAILYELLTGRPPFVGVQPLEVLGQVIADEPVRPSHLVRRVPKDIQTICLKCLEKTPGRRYGSAGDLADDFERFLADQPIVARRASTLERGWRWCRRHPVRTSLAASLTAILFLVAIISSVYSVKLGNQLSITSNAKNNEQSAKLEALQHLWESKLSLADAMRTSGQVGQRFESLNALVAAREIGKSIDFRPDQIDRMRNATIACLAQPDIRLRSRWLLDQDANYRGISTDEHQTVLAFPAGENDFVVRQSNSGSEVARVNAPTAQSTAMLSHDGKKLVVLNDKCRAYRIDVEVPELIFESPCKGAWGFTPDGKQILGTSENGVLSLFDLRDGTVVRSFPSLGVPYHVVVSPDSSSAAMVVDGSVQVIQLQTGEVNLDLPPVVFTGQHFAWHPNSNVLAVGPYADGIELWNVVSGSRLTTLPQISGRADFCFNSTGDLLLVYDIWAGRLDLWNVGNGELELSQTGRIFAAVSPDEFGGFQLLEMLDNGEIATVIVEQSRVCRAIPLIHEATEISSTFDLAYSADGRLFAFASNGSVNVFDAHSRTLLGKLVTGACYIRFDSDGSLLTLNRRGLNRWPLSENMENRIGEADPLYRQLEFGPPQFIADFKAYTRFDVGSDGKMISVADGDGAWIWSPDKPEPLRTQGSHPDVRRLSISPDGKRVVTGGWHGGDAYIWDTHSGQLIHTIEEHNCCLVQYSPNGKWLVTDSDVVSIRDSETGSVLSTLDVTGHSAGGVSVCFSFDSKLLAVSDAIGTIHLFNPEQGSEIATLMNPGRQLVSEMAFTRDGSQLAALSSIAGGVVRIWDLAVIRDELKSRNLDWLLNDGSEFPVTRFANKLAASPTADGAVAVSTAIEKAQNGKLLFVVDEGFMQLEAEEQILRAEVAAKANDFDSARAALVRAKELSPKNPFYCNKLAWLLATGPLPLRDPITAVELARRAMHDESVADDQRSSYANTLGVALYRAGKFEDAIEILKLSLASHAPDSRAFDLFFLSMCNAQLGKPKEARDYFDQAEIFFHQYKSKHSYDWRNELYQFAHEARLLIAD